MTYGYDGSMGVLDDMDASDTAYVYIHFVGGDAVSDIINASSFSGYLAC